MKKQLFIMCVAVMFLLVSCSGDDTHKAEKAGTDTEIYIDEESTEIENHITEDIDIIEVYVESFECGYVSYADRLREGPLLITTKEELTEAENTIVSMC